MSLLSSVQISRRDRLFMLILPALAASIVYSFFLTRKPNARIQQLSLQLRTATAARPSPEALSQLTSAQTMATQRLIQARNDLAPIRQALDQHIDTWLDRRARLQANDDLAIVWRRHHLKLLEQSQVSAKDVDATPLIQRLQQQTGMLRPGEFGPALWEVRLEGEFPGLKGALEEVCSSDLPLIPVRLDMQIKPQTSTKIWTLRLWQ